MTNRGLYTSACDVWSLGILLFRMLFDHEPYGSFEEAADATSLPVPQDAEHRVSPAALELVGAMLKHDHKQRLSVDDVRVSSARASCIRVPSALWYGRIAILAHTLRGAVGAATPVLENSGDRH